MSELSPRVRRRLSWGAVPEASATASRCRWVRATRVRISSSPAPAQASRAATSAASGTVPWTSDHPVSAHRPTATSPAKGSRVGLRRRPTDESEDRDHAADQGRTPRLPTVAATGGSGALGRPGSPGRGGGRRRASAPARPRARRSPAARSQAFRGRGRARRAGPRSAGRPVPTSGPACRRPAGERGTPAPAPGRSSATNTDWRGARTAARPAANATAATPTHGAVGRCAAGRGHQGDHGQGDQGDEHP